MKPRVSDRIKLAESPRSRSRKKRLVQMSHLIIGRIKRFVMAPSNQARELCERQAAAWRSMLEPIGFRVETQVVGSSDDDRSCRVTLQAERGATHLDVDAAVTVGEYGPVWSVRAPILRGGQQVMIVRTPVLLFGPKLLQFVDRLERLDPANPRTEFGPSRWTARSQTAPPPAGGIRLCGSRGNTRTDQMLASLARMSAELYSIVAAAQAAPPEVTPEGNAQQEVILALAALTASEIKAFTQLVSIGLEGVAQVHARAVGDFATSISMYRNNPVLALEVYESFPATIVELLAQFRHDDRPEPAVSPGTSSASMRAIIRRSSYRQLRNETAAREHLLSLPEHEALSKRTHGDVTAMAQVAGALASRDGDVRAAISRSAPLPQDNEVTVRSLIVRVFGYALHAAVDLINVIPVDARAVLEQINVEHRRWQQAIED